MERGLLRVFRRWRGCRDNSLLCRRDQRPEGLHGNPESPAGEAVNIGFVDTNDLPLRAEYRTAAAAVGRGGVIDQLISDDVSQMATSGRWTD